MIYNQINDQHISPDQQRVPGMFYHAITVWYQAWVQYYLKIDKMLKGL